MSSSDMQNERGEMVTQYQKLSKKFICEIMPSDSWYFSLLSFSLPLLLLSQGHD